MHRCAPRLALRAALCWGLLVPGLAACDETLERAWVIQIDDDFLALSRHDRDYTAGASFTLLRDSTDHRRLPLALALERIDGLIRFPRRGLEHEQLGHSLEAGARLFTPRHLEAEGVLADDRPYATLAYLTSSRFAVGPDENTVLQSSLTVGLLGLPLLGSLHRGLHDLIGSPLPNGYGHQISEGGEPTFRYAISRQRLLKQGVSGDRPYAAHYRLGASFGYLTEVRASLAVRTGPLRGAWWSAPPSSADYAGQTPLLAHSATESLAGSGMIFEAGIESRLRMFNALLQGQFRRSDQTIPSRELKRLLLEGWVGFGFRLRSGLELGYTLRARSKEIEHGTGARTAVWGNVSVVRRF